MYSAQGTAQQALIDNAAKLSAAEKQTL